MQRQTKTAKPSSGEAHPDAWQRFEKAVDIGLRTKPMHKEAKEGAKKPTAKIAKPKRRA